MSMHYSPKAGGFFDTRIHAVLPTDAVAITVEEHRQLLEDQMAGAIIQPDAKGRPCAREPMLTLAVKRDTAIRLAKTEARTRILAVASIERQTNDNALIAQAALANVRVGTTIDGAALDAALARRTRIDAIRAASDVLEIAIATLSSRALAQLDVTASLHWPA